MLLRILPVSSIAPSSFDALHPMFEYKVPGVSVEIKNLLKSASSIVVVGMGGSILPLKVFVDAFQLQDRIKLVDTVDKNRWDKTLREMGKDTLFCWVSKSGETLEVRSLLVDFLSKKLKNPSLVVTDPEKGFLKKFADDQQWPRLEIPQNIGGRFTNFTAFHRALLEACEINFDHLLASAARTRDLLKKDPKILSELFHQLFESEKTSLLLWAYGDQWLGLAEWCQQVIAESLGKKTKGAKRLGVVPWVLKGPQDQHSVLQLLADGPQINSLWFFKDAVNHQMRKQSAQSIPSFEDLAGIGLENTLNVLAESTIRTFEERLSSPETFQPLSVWQINSDDKDLGEVIAIVQGFIEYAATKLGINAFDQPGVERGKQIARELIRSIKT